MAFEFEEKHNSNIEEIYNKVLNHCHAEGPDPVYQEFIDAMRIIANAAEGINEQEDQVIKSFSNDLIKRFQHDMDVVKSFEKRDKREEI